MKKSLKRKLGFLKENSRCAQSHHLPLPDDATDEEKVATITLLGMVENYLIYKTCRKVSTEEIEHALAAPLSSVECPHLKQLAQSLRMKLDQVYDTLVEGHKKWPR